jgi:cytochrome c5
MFFFSRNAYFLIGSLQARYQQSKVNHVTKKLDELSIAVTVCAPRSKGTCNVSLGECFSCHQTDPTRISVVNETRGTIMHSLKPEGEDGEIYELECDACHFTYKLGIVHKENKEGDWSFNSMFGNDKFTGNKWMWIGYY